MLRSSQTLNKFDIHVHLQQQYTWSVSMQKKWHDVWWMFMSRFIVARVGISHHVTMAVKPLLSFPVTMLILSRQYMYREVALQKPECQPASSPDASDISALQFEALLGSNFADRRRLMWRIVNASSIIVKCKLLPEDKYFLIQLVL